MAGLQSILVHMDASRRSAERLKLARQIAREQGAGSIIALLAIEPRPAPVPALAIDTELGAPPLIPQVDPEQRARARAIFDELLASGDPVMGWAEVPGDPPVWGMAQAALYADLLVLGQRDPNDPLTRDVPKDFVESVILESGKPTLVVPYAGHYPSVGHNVLIAWKPTRECAHAVAAAVPLMERAVRVHVVSWGVDTFLPAETTFGVVRYLRWHGIEATGLLRAQPHPRAGDGRCDPRRAEVDDAAGVDGALTDPREGKGKTQPDNRAWLCRSSVLCVLCGRERTAKTPFVRTDGPLADAQAVNGGAAGWRRSHSAWWTRQNFAVGLARRRSNGMGWPHTSHRP
jgi:nucleotide-binding universal stress UspA family protein